METASNIKFAQLLCSISMFKPACEYVGVCVVALPSTSTGLTGSMRDTISARSVKEALGHVTTWKTHNTIQYNTIFKKNKKHWTQVEQEKIIHR